MAGGIWFRPLGISPVISGTFAEPDPYVFGPPGGSFYYQVKIVRKTLIPTVMLLIFLKNDVYVHSKSYKQKF
jgi:hypothetical protein